MVKPLKGKLRSVRIRCGINLLIEQMARIFTVFGIVAVPVVLIDRLLANGVINSWVINSWPIWALVATGAVLIVLLWVLSLPSRMRVSLLVDERLKLHERFSTTLAIAESDDPFARAACDEARRTARRINPGGHFPIKPSKCWLYAAAAWLTVVLAAGFVPEKDLLGFLKREKQKQDQAVQVEIAKREIKQTTSTVKLAVKQLGDKDLGADLAKLSETPLGVKPEIAKRQAIKKLGDLAEKIEKKQSEMQLDSVKYMQEMLKQLRGSPNPFSDKLRLALAKGNLAEASDLLKQFQKQLAEGKLTDEQRKALARQLQNLAKQLEDMAMKNAELEKELEKLGLSKELAKLNPEQLRKACKKQGLSAEKIEQLLKKMSACRSACRRCSGMGKAMAACGGSGSLSGDDLAGLTDQLDEIEAMKQQIMLTQATLDEIDRAIACLGKGMCKGLGCQGPFSKGLAEKFGSGTGGPGRGYGPRGTDEQGQTGTKKTRVQNKDGQGPVVASWYFKGTQIKGEAKRDFAEIVQAGRDSAAEAISENEIPRKYEESVKKYFGQLENTAE